MHITRMRFGGIPPFTQQVEFKLDERVNVFIGTNASGKSTLLSEVNDFFNETETRHQAPKTSERFDQRFALVEETDYFDDWTKGKNLLCVDPRFANAHFAGHDERTLPVVYISPIRTGLPGVSELAPPNAYGSTVEEVLSGPFSGDRLQAAIDMLYEKTNAMYKQEWEDKPPSNGRRAWHFLHVDDVAHSCTKYICDELFTAARALNYPTGLDIEYLADQPMADLEQVSINRMLGVATNDVPRFEHIMPEERPIGTGGTGIGRIYVGDLSSGSQSTLLWILWLTFKMLNYYDFADHWEKQSAILLIDEIENHLHPTWQRRVIPALLEHFPGLQIFATTHSPFVVAGLKAGQVHMLNRDANGVITATTNTEDFVGWTADEILGTTMGVDDPTDDETARHAAELRLLRDQGPRDTATAEENRQNRMQELRRLVDRDLLAGGPKARRREEFAQQFREAMERRRQSDDLSQDSH